MRAAFCSLALVACANFVCGSARAQASHALAFEPVSMVLVDTPVAAGLLAVGLSLSPPARCRWCASFGPDVALSGALGLPHVRRELALVSDIGLYVALTGAVVVAAAGGSLGAGGGDRSLQRGAEDLIIITEVGLATALLTRVVKLASARERPASRLGLDMGARRHESFFSGHASQTAAAASAASTVAFLREYPFRTGVLVGGIALTLAVGGLRVLSLEHWPTDVIFGWIVGIGLGIAMPVLMHPRLTSADVRATQEPQPIVIASPLFHF